MPAVFALQNFGTDQSTLSFTFSNDYTYSFLPSEPGGLLRLIGDGISLISWTGDPDQYINSAPLPSASGPIFNLTSTANITWQNAQANGELAPGGAIYISSYGADGYAFDEKDVPNSALGGGDGGAITISHQGDIEVDVNYGGGDLFETVAGITAVSAGATGSSSKAHSQAHTGPGGDGGVINILTSEDSTITINPSSSSSTGIAAGIFAYSIGGLPGEHSGDPPQVGESGVGGAVNITHNGQINSSYDGTVGILAISQGGAGGTVAATEAENTYYGVSGPGGAVDVEVYGNIDLTGSAGVGVLAASLMGDSNPAADPEQIINGETATVNIYSSSTISVGGQSTDSLSIGALAISAGTSTVLQPFGTFSENVGGSGLAGDATINNQGTVNTQGELAVGLAAIGVGGAGIISSSTSQDGLLFLGNTGSSVFNAQGSTITINNEGSVTTLGDAAHGMVAVSSAGGGLLRITDDPIYIQDGTQYVPQAGAIIGGNANQSGGEGLNGSAVSITNTGSVTTGNGQGDGKASIAIVAQSIGGAGGSAGGLHPAILVGGAGGGGGDGGAVTVNLQGSANLTTYDQGSYGVLAQSIGGGGGNGANAAGLFVATGGSGGEGGNGGSVTLNLGSNATITTADDFAGGMITHSIGGGGGHGGSANGFGPVLSITTGGSGGNGGDGGSISVATGADSSGAADGLTVTGGITTVGNHSPGILAQSIGGGGGSGGGAVTNSEGPLSFAVALGGTGGEGGSAGQDVTVVNRIPITTGVQPTTPTPGADNNGANSPGMIIQAIGGGGGHGGTAMAKATSTISAEVPLQLGVSVAVGGSGGGSQNDVNGTVTGTNLSTITTYGADSYGMVAQSIGGGGGAGGDATGTSTSEASDVPTINIASSIGGKGGTGSNGNTVNVANGDSGATAAISTTGDGAIGMVAQSIGGGGGAGGTGTASNQNHSAGGGTDAPSVNLSIGVGGQGSLGGSGGAISMTNATGSSISTKGNSAHGMLGHSVGGGGGLGGGGSTSGNGGDIRVGVDVGGNGGAAGNGDQVTATNNGMVITAGHGATGILAQSIGGGGGSAGTGSASSTMRDVDDDDSGDDDTGDDDSSDSDQLFAANSLSSDGDDSSDDSGDGSIPNIAATVNVGGGAGGAGDGSLVTVINAAGASIQTSGSGSQGILAQSIGGGGGNGGGATGSTKGGDISGNLSIGRNGSGGGSANLVTVENYGSISTKHKDAPGIMAQSIGGGGGNGGTANAGSTGPANEDDEDDDSGDDSSSTDEDSATMLASNGTDADETSGDDGDDNSAASYSGTVSVGGSGGSGGAGGSVNVNNYAGASITTKGDDSQGILAQSIGGGGGNASSGSTSGKSESITVSLAIGGSGGAGGAGNVVTIDNDGAITTGGKNASAIMAQSIGGGGGNGSTGKGNSSQGRDRSDDDDSSGADYSLSISLGGSGGAAGAGGNVTVSNASTGSLETTGRSAHAIMAQSIGGGGGNAGGANTTDNGGTIGVKLDVGGNGGGGGDGGDVSVTNSGSIIAHGSNSAGIYAQAIGGGGGSGGGTSVDEKPKTRGPNDGTESTTYEANILVGGKGGASGNGGEVTLLNDAGGSITTHGKDGFGIFAQSISGGGGSGGASKDTSKSTGSETSYQANIAVGGTGGTAGDGQQVTVTNNGSISTAGNGAHGVLAQSIGGGGGHGGHGSVKTNVTVSLGASDSPVGVTNGNGGQVQITNTGTIMTTGEDAAGIVAQSIGGGGGHVRTGHALVQDARSVLESIKNASADLTLGLSPGTVENSFGNTVSVDHSGAIQTQGDWSHGIVAQSIGGGGGKASSYFNNSTRASINMVLGLSQNESTISEEGGNAGDITLTLDDATIVTGVMGSGADATQQGYAAFGIVAQSIGGSGGFASNSSTQAQDGVRNNNPNGLPVGIQVGWEGVGDGGAITLEEPDGSGASTIVTYGEAAHAVVLQSIGASGGIAGQGSSRFDASTDADSTVRVSVGGAPGRQITGNGGEITVENITLQIQTQGDNSYGLLAQSIGGGGGLGFTQVPDATQVYVGNGGLGSNQGGEIMLNLDSASVIQTSGVGAHGIVAQSIGGGGGIANYSTSSTPTMTFTSPDSFYSDGFGADMQITTPTISTTGAGAHGVVAQSIGGGGGILAMGDSVFYGLTADPDLGSAGLGGIVEVIVANPLSATGENSVGILAQSVGADGGQQVLIEVNETVQGGSGNGAGIVVSGGSTANSITISENGAVSALSGMAIDYQGSSYINVTNNGSVAGSFNLGNGGVFTNNSANTLYAGPMMVGDLINNGRIVLGPGNGNYQQSTLDGDFTQTANGVLEINADFSQGLTDHLHILGDAQLDGALKVNAERLLPGTLSAISVDGNINGSLQSSARDLIQFELTQDGNQLLLKSQANFASQSGFMDPNHRAIAGHLQSVWDNGTANPEFGALFAGLNQINSVSFPTYEQVLAELSPGSLLSLGSRRMPGMLAFAGNVAGENSGRRTLHQDESTQLWYRSSGSTTHQTDTFADFRYNDVVQEFGAEASLSDGWYLGAAVAYEYSWMNSDNGRTSASGDGALASIYLKNRVGPWELFATGFGSFTFYDTDRRLNLPTGTRSATASPDVYSVGGLIGASYQIDLETFYLRPKIAGGVVMVHADGYTESGAGAFGLRVQSATQTTFVAVPAVEVGGHIPLNESLAIRPFMELGLALYSHDDWSQSATLVGAPFGATGFETEIPMDNINGELSVGIQVLIEQNLSLGLQFEGGFSEHINTLGGSLRAGWAF